MCDDVLRHRVRVRRSDGVYVGRVTKVRGDGTFDITVYPKHQRYIITFQCCARDTFEIL